MRERGDLTGFAGAADGRHGDRIVRPALPWTVAV